ncbi:MAG: hypothetical protein CMH13_25050 [Martelella sp.]|uniref:hypothetical protein n=1 Tax=unclassified Martelella TaxID=2629616 RepID=UPI000C39EFEB|nr:hypothetical protein [Martelella sp.]MAU23774.1 hypothetical protein [Martelella sp.]
MADKAQQKAIVKAILERYPESYAEALRINVGKNTPSPLYQWLLCALLMSARISANQARQAAAALFDAGWTTPEKMAATTWEQRVKVLNENGYARYDESTARYIADTTEIINDRYSGDLRNLRKEAENDPERERALLQQFKGIGKVGADIFFREVQVAWEEHFPFVDRKAAEAAADLGLDSEALADLAGKRENLPRLLTGLVRAALDDAKDDILAAAA